MYSLEEREILDDSRWADLVSVELTTCLSGGLIYPYKG
jgi:hypothetical protein